MEFITEDLDIAAQIDEEFEDYKEDDDYLEQPQIPADVGENLLTVAPPTHSHSDEEGEVRFQLLLYLVRSLRIIYRLLPTYKGGNVFTARDLRVQNARGREQ